MSRFLGLTLMVATAWVIVELLVAGGFNPITVGAVLGVTLLLLGFLLGFLATQRHYLWAILTSLAAILPQVASGQIHIPLPAGRESSALTLLCVPPIALLVGSYFGARALHRRIPGKINPASE